MKLFCRHCDKKTPSKISPNGPHFQAACTACSNWIKFLNTAEKSELLNELLTERERINRAGESIAPQKKNTAD